ncbi:MAG: ATP-grasp domain-containing protein [Treponema sp.]|nr:ATP-grasp domain-containing protein [Treponema sp.]
MDGRYVLILGAGLMQRPSFEAAKELGFKVLAVDANPNAVCVPFADHFELIDLKDREKIAEFALLHKENIAGVFTAGTDFSASVSYVAQKCGFKSHSFEAAVNASDKIKMRGCFKAMNVSSPEFTQIERSHIASFLKPEILDSMKFPKVVKPVDNMGARGCRLIRNKAEFLPSVEDAARNSRSGRAILEDYMEGPEFSIDSVVYNGTLTITGFADRHIYYPPYFIEMGHTMPSVFDEEKKLELIQTFAKGIAALGLTCGAAKADIKYTAKGPMIGEIAARLSGGYMSGWTYPYASSLNLTKSLMQIALGLEPKELLDQRIPLDVKDCPFKVYEVPCKNVSAERAWISIPGKIHKVYNADSASCHPFVKNMFFRSRKGNTVSFPRNNVEKCGNVISLAPTHELAVEAAEKSVSTLVLRLEKNNRATQEFLEGKCHKSEKSFPPDAFALDEGQKKTLLDFADKNPVFEKDVSAVSFFPQDIIENLLSVFDYNHRSLAQTLKLFDSISPGHARLDTKLFVRALIRGGIQGILYVADCNAAKKERRGFPFK